MQEIKGFTLAELMLAVAIILTIVISIMATYIYCIFLNQSNHNLVIAANDAQYVLEQIKGLAYEEIPTYISNFSQNYFSNLANETINISLEESGRIANVSVNVTWQEKTRPRSFLLKTKLYRYANTSN